MIKEQRSLIDRLAVALAVSMALVSCSESPSANAVDNSATNAAEGADSAQPKQFAGWGSFKFGMSFDDAFTAQSGVRWDGDSFRKCRDEMPIRGCNLWPSDESYVPLTAGIALLPILSFNQRGELTTVDMNKQLKDLTPAQCERAHGQLLDYLDTEWGPGKPRPRDQKKMLKRTTPKGRTFYRSPGNESVFLMDIEEYNELPDGRHISIISHYSKASEYTEARCWLSIYFEGPKSLERPPYEKPKELTTVANETNSIDNTIDDIPVADEDVE